MNTFQIPEGFYCEAGVNCACVRSTNKITSCSRLKPVERASGMTREEAMEPHSLIADMKFGSSEGPMKYERDIPHGNPSLTSPGESVPTDERKREFREACEKDFEEVRRLTAQLTTANDRLETDALSARLRREQRNAFNHLSQAQYRLEMSFDRVPPKKD